MTRSFALLLLAGCNTMAPLSTIDDGSNAKQAYADLSGEHIDVFTFGGATRNEVVDILFVLDNSVSMRPVLAKVRDALLALDHESFPPETRIAFTSTVPAKSDHLDRPHQDLRKRKAMLHDPGFARLVSRESIARSREAHPATADRFPLEGCDAWFRPGDTNADNISCMLVHSITSQLAMEAEAGLTAVDQMMARNLGKPTFRPGASVNVVFISDTHDPGVGTNRAADLLDIRPTGHDLVQSILADNPVSSVRLHAIAPRTECVEKWHHLGPSYFDAAEQTGGVQLDVCTATDYRPLLEAVLDVGAAPNRPVFGLVAPPEEIHEVLVDGVPAVFQPHATLRTVEVELPPVPNGSTTSPEHQIEVRYRSPVTVAPVGTPQGL